MTDFSHLRDSVTGTVLEPSDEGFAEALTGFDLGVTHSPEAVLLASSRQDAAAAVRFALDRGLPVRALATGHSAAPITEGLVISLRGLDTVAIDPEARIATIGGGVDWGSVVQAAAPYGLAPVAGSSPTVGAVGFLLGGGLGPLARSHGFGSDWVRGYTVVSGGGELLEATATENAELFWALRGGKGGLGIVVEARVELAAVDALYGGNALFPTDAIEPVLRAWVDYTTTAPADATTSVAIMRMPPFEQVPEPLRGRTVIALRWAQPADGADAALTALREVASPIVDRIRPLPLAEIATVHDDPTEPADAWASGGMLSSVDQQLASVLLEHVGPGEQVPLVMVELRHLGSATARDVPGGSAVGGRGNDFALTVIGALGLPGGVAAVDAAADSLFAALEPWTAAEPTINFAAPGRPLAEFRTSWPVETWDRLAAVRARYDPRGVFPFGPGA